MRAAAFASVMMLGAPAIAQDAGLPAAMRVPWVDVAPHVEGDAVVTVALGTAGARHGPLAAQRLWARQEAASRARTALHAWIDAAIARAMLAPDVIGALHRVIDEHATVTATRARVDGSACVQLSVPLALLAVCTPGVRGLPWSA
jgi:hypothetical protein